MNIQRNFFNTNDVLFNLISRQGGSLFFNNITDTILGFDSKNLISITDAPIDYKQFSISIYDTFKDEDIAKLVFFVNPKDIAIGQTHVFNSAYTRMGWINTAWGNQQYTIAATGVSSGFYFFNGSQGGLTNVYRKRSPGFLNLLDIIGLFKNNGWYFLDGETNPTLFKDGTSRVINVMDTLKIEYDGSTYLGSFNTFTLNDVADSPYKLDYNFEFVGSSFGTDLQGIDGHISRNDNKLNNVVNVALQGFNVDFSPLVELNESELNTYFSLDSIPSVREYDYTDKERENEIGYYDTPKGKASVVEVAANTFRVTRGWRDTEPHEGKCDFRTYSGNIYALSEGYVHKVQRSYVKGASNYVIISSTFSGQNIFVRYFHLDPDSITVQEEQSVQLGDIIGREGTDGGLYPPHCDFEVKEILGMNTDYSRCKRINCTPLMDNNVYVLKLNGYADFQNIEFKHGRKN